MIRLLTALRFSSVLMLALVLFGCGQEPEVTDYQGRPLILKSKNDWLVVNYWASWCDPCREEIPELNLLGKSEHHIRVWGVDFDNPDSVEELQDKVQRMGITFPVIAPARVALLELEQPPVLPATYIVSPDGVMKQRLLGPQTENSLLAAVDALRKESPH